MIWALGLYALLGIFVTGAMIGVSALLGERHRERDTAVPYESGMPLTGGARRPITAQYYLVAIVFVLFDLEAVFIFGWAVAMRDVGWAGWIGMLVFVLILLAGLAFEWRQGTLDWGTPGPRRRRDGRGRT